MKILLINQTFHPDVVATAQHLTDFALHLVKSGHDVTVLTGRRGYAEPHPLYPARENIGGVKVVRVWPFKFSRKTRFERILHAVLANLAFAWGMVWLGRFDKVVALTSPPLVAFCALVYSRLYHTELYTWVMDVNPDEVIEAGWMKKESFHARVLECALRAVLKGSKKIIVLDRFMKDRLIMKGADPEKIIVLPPWTVIEDWTTVPHEDNPFRKKYSLNGKFVVMYSGNFSICHPLDTLLEAAKLMKDDSKFTFMFIGGGERVGEVLNFKEKFGLGNLIYLPYQARSELSYSLSAADLHAVVMGVPFVGVVHPCKIYGILGIGRPFVYVGPKESAIGEMMSAREIGYRVGSGEAEALVEKIREASKLSNMEKIEIEKQEKKIAEQYSKEILCTRLAEEINA